MSDQIIDAAMALGLHADACQIENDRTVSGHRDLPESGVMRVFSRTREWRAADAGGER
jgi:hypothetical protein